MGYWNLTLSMRSSTVQVPVPLAEFTCHWIPTTCLGVAIVELEGLLKAVKASV